MQIRIALEQRFAEVDIARASSQLFPALQQACPFEIPEQIKEKIRLQVREKYLESLEKSDSDEAERESNLAKYDSEMEDTSESIAREQLLFYFLRLHLDVQAEDPEKTIQVEAAQRGIRPETYRKELLDQNRLEEIQVRSMRRKLTEALLKRVRIERI